jgi:O-succinylbenzoic acid--CoA ligase
VPALEHVDLAEGDLVAVTLPPSPGWLDLVSETWEARAAILPIDHRLPPPERDALLERGRPAIVLDETGARRVEGESVEAGTVLMVASSGTADVARLARFDRAAIEAAVETSTHALGASNTDGWLCCLPPAHVGGLLVLLRALLLGAPVSVHERFEPRAVLAEPGMAFASVVPTMLERLVDSGEDLSSFRSILVGGAHLDPGLRARAERAGAHVVETYGMTESCGGVVYDGMPLRGTDVRIGPEGEIELRGPTLMRGYRLDASAPFTDDGWLRTADAGELGADGRLHVTGRLDDLVITGGEKVWPDRVEAAITGHPAVREVAAGGRTDPEWGQRVAIWVVPRDPAEPPTLEELRAFAATLLPRYALPRELILVERLPRTGSGKVRRADLRGN